MARVRHITRADSTASAKRGRLCTVISRNMNVSVEIRSVLIGLGLFLKTAGDARRFVRAGTGGRKGGADSQPTERTREPSDERACCSFSYAGAREFPGSRSRRTVLTERQAELLGEGNLATGFQRSSSFCRRYFWFRLFLFVASATPDPCRKFLGIWNLSRAIKKKGGRRLLPVDI